LESFNGERGRGRGNRLKVTLEKTISFMKTAHEGQTDKGGNPYWEHPLSVMCMFGPNASLAEKQAALLHDVIEDTDYSENDLLTYGFERDAVDAVVIVSRDPKSDLTYMDWIRYIANSGNMLAIKVKYFDLIHNSLPWRIQILPEREKEILKRYKEAKKILKNLL